MSTARSPPASIWRAYGGRKARTTFEILDHLTLSFEFPNRIHANFEGNQLSPPGFKKVGEEFTGTKGVLETSRNRLIHTKGPNSAETIPSKRDITIDAFDAFLTRIQSGDALNMADQSARSAMIGLLGRAALYKGREVAWEGEFSSA